MRRLIRKYLGAALVAGTVLAGPGLWQWVRNPAPVEMAFGDYLDRPSKPDWVVLRGVFVDNLAKVETQLESKRHGAQPSYSYLPLRLGPDDPRPVKVFLRPTHYVSGARVAVLAREGEAGLALSERAAAMPKEALQEVHALRLTGVEAGDDVRAALRAGSYLPTDPDLIVLDQNERPGGGFTAIAAAMLGAISLGFAATFLGGGKTKAGGGPGITPA